MFEPFLAPDDEPFFQNIYVFIDCRLLEGSIARYSPFFSRHAHARREKKSKARSEKSKVGALAPSEIVI